MVKCSRRNPFSTEKHIYRLGLRLLHAFVWALIGIFVVTGGFLGISRRVVASNSTIFTFEYAESGDAQKVLNKYEKLIASDNIHLVNLDPKTHLNGKIEYKQTTKYSETKYLGDLKGGKPHGIGILFEKDGADELYRPEYIGNFSKGFMDGYGISFQTEGMYCYPKSEAHYKDGERNGQCYEYMVDMDWAIANRYSKNAPVYDTDNGSVVFDFPLAKTELYSVGKMKNDKRDGKWTINNFMSDHSSRTFVAAEVKYSDNGKKAKGKLYYEDGTIRYDGEMNGSLVADGKGTKYREDGSIEHKGEFKKGDIKN